MSSPFPGMDPYLEHPELWPEVHNRLIIAIADAVAPSLPAKYRVAIQKRTYLSEPADSVLVGIPDVSVLSKNLTHQSTPSTFTSSTVATAPRDRPLTVRMPMPVKMRESYLEITEVPTGAVVTVIEVLSPTNKRSQEGRRLYELKRQQVLASVTHLVEIDLLRGGKPLPIVGEMPSADYRISICRGDRRPLADLYTFTVREEIPSFTLPLDSPDAEPLLELQVLLNGVYERARYHLAVDYSREPVPRLQAEDAAWAEALLRDRGLR